MAQRISREMLVERCLQNVLVAIHHGDLASAQEAAKNALRALNGDGLPPQDAVVDWYAVADSIARLAVD